MTDRNAVILAFQKLLAPRPCIWIFPNLKGWWSDVVEVPETYQIIIGLSAHLYEDIRYEILAKTGRELTEICDVKTVQSFYTGEDLPPKSMLRHVRHAITITPKEM
jgi:hypothetical protein